MFSWNKKKEKPKKKTTSERTSNSKKSPFDEFGIGLAPQPDDEELEAELRAITGVQGSFDSPEIGGEEDSDVEAELMKLINAGKSKKSLKSIEKSIPPLKNMKAESISSSVDEDEDIEVDENDPELLNELLELTNPEAETPNEPEEESSPESEESAPKEQPNVLIILNERLEMYKAAEAKAKENNESSRARRFNRGIKTIQDLIKKVEAGQIVLLGDIPPLIATNLKPPPPKNEIPELSKEILSNNPDGDSHILNDIRSEKKPDGQSSKVDLPKIEENKPEVVSGTCEKVARNSPEKEALKNKKEGDDIPKSLHAQVKPEIPKRQLNPPSPNFTPSPTPNTSSSPEKKIQNKKMVDNNSFVISLKAQREEYKLLALKAKKNNELQAALDYVKKVKELDNKIIVAEKGEPMKTEPSTPSSSKTPKVLPSKSPQKLKKSPSINEEDTAIASKYIMDTPKTVLEALEQRLRIYNDLLQKSEKQNDKIAALKNRKIVQIYIDAIRLHKQGKKVPLQKLPTPPGCPPIPLTF